MAKMNLLDDFKNLVIQELHRMGYSPDSNDCLNDILYRYVNVVRKVPPIASYSVYISKQIEEKSLPVEIEAGLQKFIEKAKTGVSLRPYVSTRIIDFDYADLLFYDWGILHFHLGNEIDDRGFIKRTNELLFAITDPNSSVMYLLDVLPHNGSFSNQKLLAIIESNWPEILEPYTMSYRVNEQNSSNEGIAKLRNAGCNILGQTPGGRTLIGMGGGISLAKTSVLNNHHVCMIKESVQNIQKKVVGNKDKYEEFFLNSFGKKWDELDFKLLSFGKEVVVTEVSTGQIVIKERRTR